MVKSCYAIIKELKQIKGYLSEEQLQQLVCSDIFSQLDYCNSLYYGINSSLLVKLQRVQNCAARLVSKNRIAHGSMDKVMTRFHWLKVKYRIIYKILMIVYNCLHGDAPTELISMLQYADSSRTMNLRETMCLSKYGDRAFSHVGPKMWNLMPADIRNVDDIVSFKKALKSFLMLRGEEFCEWMNRR